MENQKKLKKLLENKGENAIFQWKMFLKSYDITRITQFLLLFIPSVLWICSLFSKWDTIIIDSISLILWFFSLAYFIYYWSFQESYKEWGEKYMSIYHKFENYYKLETEFNKNEIDNIIHELNLLNEQKKPWFHFFAKWYVDRTIEKEAKYWNEKKPWFYWE